ncbi:hypothetical protein BUE80_DR013292 [Diplocarpon rosae]|nr:hypothetical protein BUE80_DR013292 [Diplocarpon rosae]
MEPYKYFTHTQPFLSARQNLLIIPLARCVKATTTPNLSVQKSPVIPANMKLPLSPSLSLLSLLSYAAIAHARRDQQLECPRELFMGGIPSNAEAQTAADNVCGSLGCTWGATIEPMVDRATTFRFKCTACPDDLGRDAFSGCGNAPI